MSNVNYPKALERALSTGLNLNSATVKAQLVDAASYTYSASHQFLSDVPAPARIGAPVTLSNKSITNGAFSADPSIFTGLSSAPSLENVLIYVDTGVESTSYLVYFADTGTGLPMASGATGVTVSWPSGIFSL